MQARRRLTLCRADATRPGVADRPLPAVLQVADGAAVRVQADSTEQAGRVEATFPQYDPRLHFSRSETTHRIDQSL